jgi:hypothetical protein
MADERHHTLHAAWCADVGPQNGRAALAAHSVHDGDVVAERAAQHDGGCGAHLRGHCAALSPRAAQAHTASLQKSLALPKSLEPARKGACASRAVPCSESSDGERLRVWCVVCRWVCGPEAAARVVAAARCAAGSNTQTRQPRALSRLLAERSRVLVGAHRSTVKRTRRTTGWC